MENPCSTLLTEEECGRSDNPFSAWAGLECSWDASAGGSEATDDSDEAPGPAPGPDGDSDNSPGNDDSGAAAAGACVGPTDPITCVEGWNLAVASECSRRRDCRGFEEACQRLGCESSTQRPEGGGDFQTV